MSKDQFPTVEYTMGYSAGAIGPNTSNCDFSLFATKWQAQEWQRGYEDGQKVRGSPPKQGQSE